MKTCNEKLVTKYPLAAHKHVSALLLYTALLALPLLLLADVELDPIRIRNLEKTEAWFFEKQAVAETNEHWKTLPRILIDTKEPAVFFKAEATGLAANEIVEFFLIGEQSGNAYEAIAVALAEPEDIANAIEAMGLPRGKHAEPGALRFWPQGERVHLYLGEHHAADLLLDRRTGSTAKRDGFVFTASRKVERDGTLKRAVQVEPPFSIAANYNEPNNVLDVPFRAPQAEVYTLQVQNPEIRFEPGELLTVRIIPERTDGSMRVQQMNLTVSATEETTSIPLTDLRFTMTPKTDTSTDMALAEAPPQGFLAHIRDMIAQQKDPFVALHIDHNLSLAHAHVMARLLERMEDEEGLRILPPPAGNLYYRAFIPDESRRERADRHAHPWELHLSEDAPPVLVHIQEEWQQGQLRPEITVEYIRIEEPDQLAEKMRTLRPEMNAVFIYAPRTMRMGDIMGTVQHFRETHPFLHIFMTPSPHGQTSGEAPATTSE